MKSDGAIEGLTIVVIPRDRYSVFPQCIQAIYDHTNIPFRLIVVSGGTDNKTKEYLERVQSQHHNMHLVLVDRLLMQGEARNLAMSQVEEQFCVVLENDTIVHNNWIVPMLKCMREERAAVVMPLVLWYGRIHAAGCVFEEGGTGGRRILSHKILYARTKRRRIDYPECHCILIDRLQIPDTEIFEDVEPFDVDLGLMLRKHGLSVFLEPLSVVTYSALPQWQLRDIPLFKFRWDPISWRARNTLFMKKWEVLYDPSSKLASYRRQQLRLGLARWFPNKCTVGLANKAVGLEKKLLSVFLPGQPYAS